MSGIEGKWFTRILLAAAILLGLMLRLHHVGYPPSGFIAMKEVQYLSIATGFLDHGDFLHKRVLYTGMAEGDGLSEEFAQTPFISFIAFLVWKLTSVSVVSARLIVIISSIGTIFLTYLVARELEADELFSALAAFFMATLPLSAFFGRCFQQDVPTLLLQLLYTFFFLRWTKAFRRKDLWLFCTFLTLSAFSKINFVLGVIPLLFVFPFGRLPEAKVRIEVRAALSFLLVSLGVVGGWLLVTRMTLVHARTLFSFYSPDLTGLSFEYWRQNLPMVLRHVHHNFSVPLAIVFLAGLVFSAWESRSRRSRYLLGSIAFVVVHFAITTDLSVLHPYYQVPFLPFVAMSIALPVRALSRFTAVLPGGDRWTSRLLGPAVVSSSLTLSFLATYPALLWHYDTIAIGVEVAGRYVSRNSTPDERIFLSFGSPSDNTIGAPRSNFVGVFWEANRRGDLLPAQLETLKFGERERNMSWILVYHYTWLPQDYQIFNYIRENYSVRQIGYFEGKPFYYLLKRGGRFEPETLRNAELKQAAEYEFSTGKKVLYVRER